jgi:ribosome modulation factor
MPDNETLDPHQTPYHPFEETDRYQAFQNGWEAQRQGASPTANPYSLSRAEQALAWLDGWTAAREQEGEAAGTSDRAVVGQRREAGLEGAVA